MIDDEKGFKVSLLNMALVNCPECDYRHSTEAHTCPQCGKPAIRRSSSNIVKIVFIVLLVTVVSLAGVFVLFTLAFWFLGKV